MGVSQSHALGREQRFYARRETTYATYVQPGATHAARVKKADIKYDQERRNRADARQTRSLMERITGIKNVEWMAELYVLPSGTAGTPPDIHDLLRCAMGGYANSPGTSDTYSLADGQSALASCTIAHEMSETVNRQATGAFVESMKVSVKGGDEPVFAFAGGASDYVHTGPATLGAAITYVATPITSVTLTAGTAPNIDTNSVIQIDGNDNGGAGFLVTAGGGTTTLTISPGISVSVSNGAEVLPFVPTETVAGSPIASILGSLTLAGVSLPITEFELEIKNNIKALKDQAFTAATPDYIVGFREVTGSIKLRARKDQIIHLGKYKNAISTTQAIVVTCGSTAGARMVITVPYAEIDKAALDVPEQDEAMITLPFVAMGSSGADELTIAFT